MQHSHYKTALYLIRCNSFVIAQYDWMIQDYEALYIATNGYILEAWSADFKNINQWSLICGLIQKELTDVAVEKGMHSFSCYTVWTSHTDVDLKETLSFWRFMSLCIVINTMSMKSIYKINYYLHVWISTHSYMQLDRTRCCLFLYRWLHGAIKAEVPWRPRVVGCKNSRDYNYYKLMVSDSAYMCSNVFFHVWYFTTSLMPMRDERLRLNNPPLVCAGWQMAQSEALRTT
jgi:hypothetical protein